MKNNNVKKLRVQMYYDFKVWVNEKGLDISEYARELLALLVVAGGRPVTSKIVYQIIFRPKKLQYNGKKYSLMLKELELAMRKNNIAEVICTGQNRVRFCKIIPENIECDYYQALDSGTVFEKEKWFLPQYPWARKLHASSWEYIDEVWKSIGEGD